MKLNTSNLKKMIPILHQKSDIERRALFEKDVPFVFKGYSFFFQYELKQINVFLEKKGFTALDHHLTLSSISLTQYPLSYQEIDDILKGVQEELSKNTKICTAVWMSFWIERGEQHFFDLSSELKGLWQRILVQTLLETDIYQKNHPLHQSILDYFDFLEEQFQQGFLFTQLGFWKRFKKHQLLKKLNQAFKDYQSLSHKSFKALQLLSDLRLQEPAQVLGQLLFLIYWCVKQLSFWSYQFFETQQAQILSIKEELQALFQRQNTLSFLPSTLIQAMTQTLKIPSLKTMLIATKESKLDLCVFPELYELSEHANLEAMLFLKQGKADLSQQLLLSYVNMLTTIIRRGRVVEHIDEQVAILPSSSKGAISEASLLWMSLPPKTYQIQLHPGQIHIPSEHTKKR